MNRKELIVNYGEYRSADEMDDSDRELALAAVDATSLSYAPYSNFHVGAAVRMSDGRIFKGANQENIAYPSGLCAERTTLFYAHAHRMDGHEGLASNETPYISSIAIAAEHNGRPTEDPVTPCGACRQVMAEFQAEARHPMSIIMVGASRILKFDKVEDILPFIFDSV